MSSRADGYTAMFMPELDRRLASMIRYGEVSHVDYADAAKPRIRVKSGQLESGWLPFSTGAAGGNGEWNPLEVGEQVLLASPSGELSQSVVIARVNKDDAPAPSNNPESTVRTWKDGAREEYNRETHTRTLTIPAGGTYQVNVGAASLAMADNSLTVTIGGVSMVLNGSGLTVNDGKITSNVDVIAVAISLLNHLHGGVIPGGANTAKPVG